jgi:hypothetical protein
MSYTDQGVAKFIFNTEVLNEIELPLVDLNPKESKEYLFAVSNNKSDSKSDVSIEYMMTLKTYHLVPLNIELYKIDGEVEDLVLVCDETYTRNSENELVCNTPVEIMNHSSLELDNYKLKVEFTSGYDDEIYSNLVDYINIEIKSWQKIGE